MSKMKNLEADVVESLVSKLMKAKEDYYNNTPNITDAEFDALEDNLRELDPDNDYFSIVGAVNSKAKVKHEIPMLSAGKGKTVEDIMNWLKRIDSENAELIVQPKVDGMSANVVYDKGKLILIATRGDGKIGQDVTHLKDYIKIPKTIPEKNRVEVRGELYLPKNTEFPNPDNKPLRNICVGLVARKDEGLEDLKHVRFVAYQVFGSDLKFENDKMSWMTTRGFSVVWYTDIITNVLSVVYDSYVKTLRDEWQYETDGLMITINNNSKWENINSKYTVDHHNHYNIAWKPAAEAKETVLLDIEWHVSRQGKLIPVAVVEPVILGSATVQRCTLNNYENVLRMKLERGDKVKIEKSGDIIPYMTSNVSKNIRQR